MSNKTYTINPAKIGNQKGWRLPTTFYQDNPHLADKSGQIEVLNDDTLLIRLDVQPESLEEDEDGLMMSLFLDFLMRDVIKNPDKLIPYTMEMTEEVSFLLADVNLEEE